MSGETVEAAGKSVMAESVREITDSDRLKALRKVARHVVTKHHATPRSAIAVDAAVMNLDAALGDIDYFVRHWLFAEEGVSA